MKRHRIDIGEAVGLIGAILGVAGKVRESIEAARADGEVTPEEALTIAKVVLHGSVDTLADRVVAALAD